MKKVWSPTQFMEDNPIRLWKHQWDPPDQAHGYIHIFDGAIRYVGMSRRNCVRSFTFHGRTKEHLYYLETSKTSEVRHYPQESVDSAYAWERYTIERAVDAGYDLCNRTGVGKGVAFMRKHLPKTYNRYMNEDLHRKYRRKHIL